MNGGSRMTIAPVSLFANPQQPARRSPVDILVVCTGNICRSPLAASLFARRDDLVVDSAGTHAVHGAAMDAIPAELAERWGGSSDHLAKQLRPEHIERAALILTLTREHRAAVLRLHGAAQQRTFTLAEFERQLHTHDDALRGDIPALVRAAARGRVDEPADDIADPFRRGREVHELVGAQILAIVERTSARIVR